MHLGAVQQSEPSFLTAKRQPGQVVPWLNVELTFSKSGMRLEPKSEEQAQ